MEKQKIRIVMILLMIIILFMNFTLMGQQNKYEMKVGAIVAQYVKIEEGDFTSVPGYYNFPISPGIELLLSRHLWDKFSIETGINIQQGNVSSYVNEVQKRFHFTEVSIPILLQKTFLLDNNNSCYFSTGIYLGKVISIKDDYYTSFGWEESSEIQKVIHYSDDKTMSDLYIDLGYSKPLTSKLNISFSPFFKYRFNSTWLNYHYKKIHYGIKINVSLKL